MESLVIFQREMIRQQMNYIKNMQELGNEMISASVRTSESIINSAVELQQGSVKLAEESTKNFNFISSFFKSMIDTTNPIIESIKIQQDFIGKMLNKF